MCMPQLQEGDEIIHINGRTVKDLPHREVLKFKFVTFILASSEITRNIQRNKLFESKKPVPLWLGVEILEFSMTNFLWHFFLCSCR